MKDKMIVEEIGRIGEIMGINHLLVENPGFFKSVLKSAKSGKKIVDLSKISATALKTVKYGALEAKVFKQIKSLGSSSKGFDEVMGIGLSGKGLSTELSGILKLKPGELPGAAIIRNIDNPEFVVFMNGTGREVTQINKNIQKALGNVEAGGKVITDMNKVSSTASKVKPKVKPKVNKVNKVKTKVTGTTPKGPRGQAIRNTLGKTGDILKTGWAWTKRVVIGNILGKMVVLGLGAWAAWNLFQWWFEEDGRLSSEQAMKTAFSGHLASEYDNTTTSVFDNSLGSGAAIILAEQVANNPQSLPEIVESRCKSLRDISAISFHWSNMNGGSQLYDMLKAWENSDRSQGGFSGLYDPLESIVSKLPLVILGGVACFTISELQAQEQLLGIEHEDVPMKGDVQGDWSNYPCILTMLEEYNGSVGNSGDIEYIKITIDNRDAYFTPNGKVQLEDFSDNSKNLHGTYTCDGETSVKFEESRKLSDILKESKLIVEETVEFGDVTITIGGGSGEENTTTYNDGEVDSENTNDDVDSETTNGGGSGLKYVITSVTLADVVSGNGELKKGDKGDSVRAIQTSVNTKDDSMFGPNTEEAVRVYQKRNGLEVTGTINKETAKRIVGTTDVPQSGDVVSTDTEITQQDTNDMDMVEKKFDNSDPTTIKVQIEELDKEVDNSPTKELCKALIASASSGIKKGVYLTDLSSLKQCYDSYNFYAIGDGSKKVRKHYGLKGKGNI